MKKILISDDHSIVRIGTSLLLNEALNNSAEIAEAATFEQSLKMIEQEDFDLILLDINIPGGNNLDMIQAIKLRNKKIKILIFSSYEESMFAIRYIRSGADGYLSKDCTEETLKKAVLHVLEGKIFISDSLKEQNILNVIQGKSDKNYIDLLSNRELEVANLLIKGNSTKEISNTLSIRSNTVSTYKANIYEKLGVNNVVDLISKLKLFSKS